MPLIFVNCDITKLEDADAIVNSTNSDPTIIGTGVEEAIFEAAGHNILNARREIGVIAPGTASFTDAFNLKRRPKDKRIIIHTVAVPYWKDKNEEEAKGVLRSCYLNSLYIANRKLCKTIAFPFIGTGVLGYPNKIAFSIAVETISSWLMTHRKRTVYLCVSNEELKELAHNYTVSGIEDFIEENYLESSFIRFFEANQDIDLREGEQFQNLKEDYENRVKRNKQSLDSFINSYNSELKFMDLIKVYMDEYKLDPDDICAETRIDKSYYYKLVKGERIPSRNEVFRLAFAMHLSEEEFKKLLWSAGRGGETDLQYVIVLWHIREKKYDIDEINKTLRERGAPDLDKQY